MSTYSPSLRIELITTGDQAGTWGTTTNTNLGTLIEAGITGYTSVAVIAADQALTALYGAADESRNAVIALTTTTGANFNVYAPPAEKTYIIYNASSYTATVYNSTVIGNTTAAGTGVAIPAGKTMTIWSDGTNFAVQNNHFPAITLTTDLAVADGGTGASTASGARTNLGAAASGANSDITSLSGLTTPLSIAQGGTAATTASGARTSLGATTIGGNMFTLTNPSAVTFPRFNADNTVSALDAATFRAAIGANTGSVTSVALTTPTGLTVAGSPITTSGTLAISLQSGYSIPTTASQTNWDSAYTQRLQWDGGATNLVAATGRTSLGATTVGSNLFTLTNPSAVTFPRFNADNTVSALTAADFRTAISAAPSTSGTSILYGDGSGGFSNVTVGSGLTFSTGTLSSAITATTSTSTKLGLNTGSTNAGAIIVGNTVGTTLTSGAYNDVVIGNNAVVNATGGEYTAVGVEAARYATGTQNTVFGYQAFRGDGFVGFSKTGDANCAFGTYALRNFRSNTTGNTALGWQSGGSFTEGNYNVFVGRNSAAGVTSGSSNVVISGTANIFFSNLELQNCTLVGASAGTAVTSNLSNATMLGSFTGVESGGLTVANNYVVLSDGAGTWKAYWDNNQNFVTKVSGTAPTLPSNSTMTFELTSNTQLKIFVKGTDGVTRSTTLTLS